MRRAITYLGWLFDASLATMLIWLSQLTGIWS